jgi:hypothetical protein
MPLSPHSVNSSTMDNSQRSIAGGTTGSQDPSGKCSNIPCNCSLCGLGQKLNPSAIASSAHARVGSQMSESARYGNSNSIVAAEGTKSNARTASGGNPSDQGQLLLEEREKPWLPVH